MSQTTMSNEQIQHVSSTANQSVNSPVDFSYRPVPILACVTLTLGILSSTALLVDFGVVIAFAGAVLSIFAFRQQKKSAGSIGGKNLVWAGCVTSVVFFFGGLTTHIYAFNTELPEDHIRVNFPRDIAMKKLKQSQNGAFLIPKDVVESYEGKKIFIKGFMYQTKTLKDLASFTFLKDNGQCCMGGDPKPWDNMTVVMMDGQKVDAILDRLISISGTLKINRTPSEGESVYILLATQVEKAKTRY